MSELWSIEVLNRGERWVDLAVNQVHPDAGAMPESKGFALGLLLDGGDDAPIREPFGDEWYEVEGQESRAEEFIESVRIYELRNAPFDEKGAHAKVDAVLVARGLTKGGEGWDDAWQDEWREWWSAPNGPPRAIYRIVVKDPRWVEHLEPGKTFDSAGYSDSGPWAEDNRDEHPPLPADAVVKEHQLPFPLSYVPRGERAMNAELVRQLCGTETINQAALDERVRKHADFLATGGRDGEWTLLEAAGLPMCIYGGADAESGEQLKLTNATVAPKCSFEAKDIAFANLSGTVCEGVSFQSATLDGSVAIDGFFDGSTFASASLQRVDFSGASLKGCNFSNADLRGADFEHTDCTGADFRGARLEGARFPGAILASVRR